MNRIGLIIILLSKLIALQGQFYTTGQAPTSLRWKQINTDNFQLIYPEEIYSEANRVANIIELIYDKVKADYKKAPKKISVVLHNRSILSNGYVAWAPRRMQWVCTPPTDNDAMDWLEHLALHEYRHVVQLTNLEQGITKIIKFLVGEAAAGAVAGVLPLWFFEGDAVLSETAYSSAGRGRSPEFDRELRTIEGERERRFSYDQSYMGSYKYSVPNYYQYGYQMVSYAQVKNGSAFWPNTVNTVARKRFTVAPFYWGLRKSGATSKEKLYHAAMDSLHASWAKSKDVSFDNPAIIPVPQTKHYTSYQYVQSYKEGYFAVRSGINDITRFVYLHNATEEVLHTPGYYFDTRIDISDKYACWEEYMPDLRWQQQNFSCIKLLNFETGKVSRLERKTRRFSPALAPSNDRLACIHVDLQNKHFIQVLDLPGGELLQEIPIEGVSQIFSPVWINDSVIAYITLNNEGKAIEQLNLESRKTEILYESGYDNIDNLAVADGLILFSGDMGMARNIYVLNRHNKTVSQISKEQYGADFAGYAPLSKELIYSHYTLNGFKPVRISMDSSLNKTNSKATVYEQPWIDALSKQSGFNLQKEQIPQENYAQLPYRKVLHGINIHSWAPFYINPEAVSVVPSAIAPGAMLFSQNKLSTLSAIVSVYRQNNQYFFEPRISYEGLYPVFELTARFASKPDTNTWPENKIIPPDLENGKTISLRSYLPLNFTTTKYRRYIQPEIYYRYLHRYYNRDEELALGMGYLGYRLVAYNLLKTTPRDIQPRFGEVVNFAYNHSPENSEYFSTSVMVGIKQYVPGIFRHHGLLLNFQWEQNEKNKQTFFKNRTALPRGYYFAGSYLYQLKAVGEYTMPLFYPDWSLGPALYIKRFYLTAHFDIAELGYQVQDGANFTSVYTRFYSTGLILNSDVHFVRFFVPFTPSLRVSWLSHSRSIDIDFGMSIQF